jgi:hypothetical protein
MHILRGLLGTASLFFIVAVSPTFGQKKCCVCTAGNRTFQVQQDTGCPVACESNGGTATGAVTTCANNPPTAASGSAPSCRSSIKTIAGDCKGHFYTNCMVSLIPHRSTPHRLIKLDYKNDPVFVNEIIEFQTQGLPKLMSRVEEGSGSLVDSSCHIEFGDGTSGPCEVNGYPVLTHAYGKPGDYTISLEAHSMFEWRGDNIGCRFTVSSGTVETHVKVIEAPTK